ncbi:hypothetical protein EDB19DRAFT_1911253 [Suillus lakei]|nr:hypothetical protein EDB19DRAFT_1911253 [Suillus lakei]
MLDSAHVVPPICGQGLNLGHKMHDDELKNLAYTDSAFCYWRLDALLRSSLHSHFSESLSGLTIIRAYGELDRCHVENLELVDVANRAYWLTIVNQRLVGIRLDVVGSLLTLPVAPLTVGTRISVYLGQTGVTISYIVMVQQSSGWMVRQVAENDMNSVERVARYVKEVEQEIAREVEDSPAQADWPSHGQVVMKDVAMRCHLELPLCSEGPEYFSFR